MEEDLAGDFPQFPRGFRFGTATAAYQIEGAPHDDGKGLSIWDTFAHTPGKIRTGETGDVACDSYRRCVEDVALMAELGVNAYRFSISWPRVMAAGRGAVNEQGLDYYERLVDALLARGIKPVPTLYHWDMPQALFDETGGFLHRAVAPRFGEYAAAVVKRLGDRVQQWITLNEPRVHALAGYATGGHAPGLRQRRKLYRVLHHELLAHGHALAQIKALQPAAEVGISLSLAPVQPLRETTRDRQAAETMDLAMNRVMLDPLFRGQYPEDLWRQLWPLRPRIGADDMALIAQPVDFLGVNNYTRALVYHTWRMPLLWARSVARPVPPRDYVAGGVQYTSMGWEVYPPGLYQVLRRLQTEYGNPPVYVTENGAAFEDYVDGERVRDPLRQRYLQAYLAQVARAIASGADVRGYFVWTLMDNFEWAEGTAKRFGLIRVDPRDQTRTIKDSGYWYRDLIKAQGSEAALPERRPFAKSHV